LWNEIRSAGGVGIPRLDLRSYGVIGLAVMPAGAGTMNGQLTIGIHYAYEFTNGRLTTARATGPDADLVLEVIARDEYYCETVERFSLLEATGRGLP
jgi:hypothetical protein